MKIIEFSIFWIMISSIMILLSMVIFNLYIKVINNEDIHSRNLKFYIMFSLISTGSYYIYKYYLLDIRISISISFLLLIISLNFFKYINYFNIKRKGFIKAINKSINNKNDSSIEFGITISNFNIKIYFSVIYLAIMGIIFTSNIIMMIIIIVLSYIISIILTKIFSYKIIFFNAFNNFFYYKNDKLLNQILHQKKASKFSLEELGMMIYYVRYKKIYNKYAKNIIDEYYKKVKCHDIKMIEFYFILSILNDDIESIREFQGYSKDSELIYKTIILYREILLSKNTQYDMEERKKIFLKKFKKTI